MKYLYSLIIFLFAFLTLEAQQKNQPHATLQSVTGTNSHPTYNIRGTVQSSAGYGLPNFTALDLTVDTVWVTFENANANPDNIAYFYVSAITPVTGNTADFTIEALSGSNLGFVIPNVAQIFQRPTELPLNLFDGLEPKNATVGKLNHNFLSLMKQVMEADVAPEKFVNLPDDSTGLVLSTGDTLKFKVVDQDTFPTHFVELSNDTIGLVMNTLDTLKFKQKAIETISTYDAGNGVTITGTAGFTASVVAGGQITVTKPADGVFVKGTLVTDKTNATYTAGGRTAGFRIVLDESADTSPTFNGYEGHVSSYTGVVSPTNRMEAVVNSNVSQQSDLFVAGMSDIVFNNIIANSNPGHDKMVIRFK